MLDHQQLDNNFDDLIIVSILDSKNQLLELLLTLLHLQPSSIDPNDLLSKTISTLNVKISTFLKVFLPILIVDVQMIDEHCVDDW